MYFFGASNMSDMQDEPLNSAEFAQMRPSNCWRHTCGQNERNKLYTCLYPFARVFVCRDGRVSFNRSSCVHDFFYFFIIIII